MTILQNDYKMTGCSHAHLYWQVEKCGD